MFSIPIEKDVEESPKNALIMPSMPASIPTTKEILQSSSLQSPLIAFTRVIIISARKTKSSIAASYWYDRFKGEEKNVFNKYSIPHLSNNFKRKTLNSKKYLQTLENLKKM